MDDKVVFKDHFSSNTSRGHSYKKILCANQLCWLLTDTGDTKFYLRKLIKREALKTVWKLWGVLIAKALNNKTRLSRVGLQREPIKKGVNNKLLPSEKLPYGLLIVWKKKRNRLIRRIVENSNKNN